MSATWQRGVVDGPDRFGRRIKAKGERPQGHFSPFACLHLPPSAPTPAIVHCLSLRATGHLRKQRKKRTLPQDHGENLRFRLRRRHAQEEERWMAEVLHHRQEPPGIEERGAISGSSSSTTSSEGCRSPCTSFF